MALHHRLLGSRDFVEQRDSPSGNREPESNQTSNRIPYDDSAGYQTTFCRTSFGREAEPTPNFLPSSELPSVECPSQRPRQFPGACRQCFRLICLLETNSQLTSSPSGGRDGVHGDSWGRARVREIADRPGRGSCGVFLENLFKKST